MNQLVCRERWNDNLLCQLLLDDICYQIVKEIDIGKDIDEWNKL